MARARSVGLGACPPDRARPALPAGRVPPVPVHAGLGLRDGAPRPEPPDRLQRPDLARPRRLLRARRLHDGDHDRPLARAVRMDDPRRRGPLLRGRLPLRDPRPPARGAASRAGDLRARPRRAPDPQVLRLLDGRVPGHRAVEAAGAGGPAAHRATSGSTTSRWPCCCCSSCSPGTCCGAGRAGRSWRSATTPSPPGRWASTPRSTSR